MSRAYTFKSCGPYACRVCTHQISPHGQIHTHDTGCSFERLQVHDQPQSAYIVKVLLLSKYGLAYDPCDLYANHVAGGYF